MVEGGVAVEGDVGEAHGFHLWLDSGHFCRGLGGQNSEPRARKIGIEVIFFEVSVTLSGRYLYDG